ncbi:hypothetical protein BKA63DRAFT_569093 [Paraphoma chrysanthemicola]|nr:hypothetical protein BKA63DRAFT_569093 [Paraphoma chrysanthemicola]
MAKKRMRANHKVLFVCTKSENAQATKWAEYTATEVETLKQLESEKEHVKPGLTAPSSSVRELAQKQEIFVDERRRRVKAKIRTWKEQPHQIFCVSAQDYMINTGYNLGTPPPVDVERSEIPDLKRYVATLAADRVKVDMVRYITTTIPSLLNSFELAIMKRPTIRTSTIDNEFSVQIETSMTSIDGHIEEKLRLRIFDETSLPTFIAEAGVACDAWAKWNSNSYRAFVMNSGSHATKSQTRTSWNRTLLNPVSEALREGFESAIENPQDDLKDVIREAESTLDWVKPRVNIIILMICTAFKWLN